MTIFSGQSLISRVYTSRFGNGTARWNLDRSGTKKVSGTRYSTQWKTLQKWTVPYRTVPYHAVEKRQKWGREREMGSGNGPRGGTQTRDAWGYVLTKIDRQPEWGELGWNLPRQGGVFLGLATLEKAHGAWLSSWPTTRVRGVGADSTPPGWCVSGPGNARKSPWSLALIVTDNQSEGRWGRLNPTRVMCFWAWQRSKSPWSLALIVTDNQSEGRWGGIYPARLTCPWAWQRSKKPWSLALIMTDNQSEERWGGVYPTRVTCPWAWQCSKSPRELRYLSLQTPQKYTFGKSATARRNGSS